MRGFLLFLFLSAVSVEGLATSCAFHTEETRFAAAPLVYLGRVVHEETMQSPYAAREAAKDDDVITHTVEVLEAFRGDVDATVVFRSPYSARGMYSGYYGYWGEGSVGQYWLIMGGRGQCSGTFEVAADDLETVKRRFRQYAETAKPVWQTHDELAMWEAMGYVQVRFYPQAIAAFEALAEGDGHIAEAASHQLAKARAEWNGPVAAEAAYIEHLRRFPANDGDVSSVNPLVDLGLLVYESGRFEEGLDYLSQAVQLAPTYAMPASELIVRLSKHGLDQEAVSVVERHFNTFCLAENYVGCPEFAHGSVARLYQRINLKEEAFEHLMLSVADGELGVHLAREVLKLGREIGQSELALQWVIDQRDLAVQSSIHPAILEQIDSVIARYSGG